MAEKELLIPEDEPMPIIEGTATRQRGEARWVHVLLYIIVSLIFAFFLVLGGRWLYHKTHHANKVTPAPASNNVPSEPQSSKPNTSKQQANSNVTKTAPSTTKPTTPNPQPSTQSSNNTGKLPNNGPGNVIGIFVGTSLAVATLHYILSSRTVRN